MALFSIFVLFLGFLTSTQNDSKQTMDTVTQLEQRFNAALLKRDAAEFEELLADDLVHIGFEGQLAGKTEYMSFFKHGSWKYKKYEPTGVAVKVIENVAVVTGRVERAIVVNERETTGSFAFTHVWSRTGERWRLRSSQVTSVPAPTPK